MTFYDELNLPPEASPDDIRHAYRKLAQVLHPDRHQDPELRALADSQMTRLNEIATTLLDSERRRQYDASLRAPEPNPALPRQRRAARIDPRAAGWVMLAAACGAALAWWITAAGGGGDFRSPPEIAVARSETAPVSGRPESIPRRDTQEARPRSRERLPEAPPNEPVETPPLPAPAAQIQLPEVRIPQPLPAPPPAASGLSGAWVYAPRSRTEAGALYAPEYIEMLVVAEAGTIKGRYQGRYRVGGRAISPRVAFEFQGTEQAIEWRSAAGAAGEMSLRLLPDGRMEVRWWATNPGRDMALVSGTAVLTRMEEDAAADRASTDPR